MIIRVSPLKAFSVRGVMIAGRKHFDIRQMYATQKDPEYKFTKKGVTVTVDEFRSIVKSAKAILQKNKFTNLE